MGRHGEGRHLRTDLRQRALRPGVLALHAKGHRLLTTAHLIADAFDLGQPTGPLRRLPGLSSAQVYGLTTARGRWVVKLVDPAPTAAGSTLEAAARAAGVATARPIEPVASAVGYWSALAGGYARVSEFVDGARPDPPAGPDLARWLGRSVGTITNLALGAGPARPTVAPRYAPLQPVLDELAAIVGAAWADRPALVLAHRDLNVRNVLVTAEGPVLLDFDHAGPAGAWWELVHHTFLLACADLGAEEPSETTVRAAVAAYADAGGAIGPASPQAFAGLLGGLLDWVASTDEPGLAQARRSLPLVLRGLERWSRLLA